MKISNYPLLSTPRRQKALPKGLSLAPGATLVEFSMAAMVFLLLVLGFIDAGGVIYDYTSLTHATRSAARKYSTAFSPSCQALELQAVNAARAEFNAIKLFGGIIRDNGTLADCDGELCRLELRLSLSPACVFCRFFPGGFSLSVEHKTTLENKREC